MQRSADQRREQRGTVAVIEDDVSLNRSLVRLLEAAGFRTCAYHSAGAVLAAIHAGNAGTRLADCLVLDLHLPDMSGFELQRRLAKAGWAAPVVVITAHDDPTHRRGAQDIGVIAWLTKPFSGSSLIDAVCRAMAAPEP